MTPPRSAIGPESPKKEKKKKEKKKSRTVCLRRSIQNITDRFMIRFRFGHTVSLGKGVQSVTTRYVMITHNSSSPKSTSFRTEHPNPKMSLWSHVVEGESTKVTGNVTFGTSSILQCLCTTVLVSGKGVLGTTLASLRVADESGYPYKFGKRAR